MRSLTDSRTESSSDQIWLLEHYSIYTQGVSCKDQPTGDSSDIPLVHSDRGGQITYHGPGQLVAYLLLDIRRRGLGVRQLINVIEQSLVTLLADLGLNAAGLHRRGENRGARTSSTFRMLLSWIQP